MDKWIDGKMHRWIDKFYIATFAINLVLFVCFVLFCFVFLFAFQKFLPEIFGCTEVSPVLNLRVLHFFFLPANCAWAFSCYLDCFHDIMEVFCNLMVKGKQLSDAIQPHSWHLITDKEVVVRNNQRVKKSCFKKNRIVHVTIITSFNYQTIVSKSKVIPIINAFNINHYHKQKPRLFSL